MSSVVERFDAVFARLEKAVARSGRKNDAVQLVAVSKTHGANAIARLALHWSAVGHPIFGESYMQEAREKMPQVAALLADSAPAVRPEWHFVGHVQSRKARDVAGAFSLIHSLDSLKLASSLQKVWQTRVSEQLLGLSDPPPGPQGVLIQVNVGREAQKSGVDPEGLEELVNSVLSMPELDLQGLMCLPPLAEIGEQSRPYFVLLRSLREAMEARCGVKLPHLSMGMSDDFEVAVEEGATLVRIGTDIFGARQYDEP